MPHTHDVCIRGAGIVGRTLALLLARERLRVALVTPATPAKSGADVRAYALNTAARHTLQSLRCWPGPDHATPVLAMQVQGDAGAAVHFCATEVGAEALNWIVDVSALEAQLAQAVHYQSGIDTLPAPQPAALTVVCEGRASATRAELGVPFDTVRYPQDAIATRLDCERPHGQTARQWFGPQGDILAFLPLGGPQGHAVAVVWSVPTAQADELMPLADGALAARLHEASAGALGAVQIQGTRARWPLQLAQARRWVGAMPATAGAPPAAFALAGDAAHTMHPLAGQGLNVGLADATTLAQVIASRESWRSLADAKLLRRYERARQGDWQRMRLATDGLQQLFARPEPLLASARNWGLRAFELSGPLKRQVARMAMGVA